MPAQRPGSVTTIAILQIIFGALGLCCGIAGLSGLGGQSDPKAAEAQAKTEEIINKRLPGAIAATKALTYVAPVIALLMLLSGIGLLQVQPWGRSCALLSAALGLLYLLTEVVILLFGVMPVLDDILEAARGLGLAQDAINLIRLILLVRVGISVVLLIYPLLVLYLMTRPHVKAAFAGQASDTGDLSRREPEDFYDRPEDRPPHRPGDPNIQG
jgi:hypothetical protein